MRYLRPFVIAIAMSAMTSICDLQSGGSLASTGSPDNEATRPTQRILQSAEPFAVRVEPQSHIVRPAESFKVRLRVINSTQAPRSFQVYNGGWMEHWEADNPRVHFPFCTLGRNFLETKILKPGEAYEKTISLKLGSSKPGDTVTFKMSFTPDQSEQTYWSNKVVIDVDEFGKSDGDQPGMERQDVEQPDHPPHQITPTPNGRRRRARQSVDSGGPGI